MFQLTKTKPFVCSNCLSDMLVYFQLNWYPQNTKNRIRHLSILWVTAKFWQYLVFAENHYFMQIHILSASSDTLPSSVCCMLKHWVLFTLLYLIFNYVCRRWHFFADKTFFHRSTTYKIGCLLKLSE